MLINGILLFLISFGISEAAPQALGDWLAAQSELSFAERIANTAQAELNTPYFDGPLGEGPEGTRDKDPLIDLTRVDCVTFVEQTIALSAANTYPEVVDLLQQIRYRDGKIGYEQRHHFFVSDWLGNNTWCTDATASCGVPVAKLTRTISRDGFFDKVGAPEFGDDTPDREVTVSYIPIEAACKRLDQLPARAVVTFVGKIDWLFALHCGLYIKDGSGTGLLYQASSKAGKVIATPLEEYCKEQQGRYLGILVHEIHPPAFK